MHNFSRFLIICYIVIIICLCHGKAAGHAFPVRSEPKTGETLHASPARVCVWFDCMLEPGSSTIVVQDSSGKKVDTGDGGVNASDPTLLEATLPPLSSGTYRVIWNVVAKDGHPANGEFTFSIK